MSLHVIALTAFVWSVSKILGIGNVGTSWEPRLQSPCLFTLCTYKLESLQNSGVTQRKRDTPKTLNIFRLCHENKSKKPTC